MGGFGHGVAPSYGFLPLSGEWVRYSGGLCLISLDARFPSHLLLGVGASHSLHLMQLLDVNFPNFRITMPK